MNEVPATEQPEPPAPDPVDLEVVIDMVRKLLEEYPAAAAVIAGAVNTIQTRLKASTDAAIQDLGKSGVPPV